MSENFGHPGPESNPWEDLGIGHLDFEIIPPELDLTPSFDDPDLYTVNLLRASIVSSIYKIHELRKLSPHDQDRTNLIVLTQPVDWKGYIIELHPIEDSYTKNPSFSLHTVDHRTHEYVDEESKNAKLNPILDPGKYPSDAQYIKKRNNMNRRSFANFDRAELESVAQSLSRFLRNPEKEIEDRTYEDKELRFAHFLHRREAMSSKKEDISPDSAVRQLITDDVLRLADSTVEEHGRMQYFGDIELKTVYVDFETRDSVYQTTIQKDSDRICELGISRIQKYDPNTSPESLFFITLDEDGNIIIDEASEEIIEWNPDDIKEMLNLGEKRTVPLYDDMSTL